MVNIELINSVGGDLSVVNSARVSFDKEVDTLTNKDSKLINYLADHRHTTPFRHNSITIKCDAPIFLARQLGKHQSGLSWNEVSRRYVDDEPTFFVPEEWRGRPDGSIKQGSSGVFNEVDHLRIDALYQDHMVDALRLYNGMLNLKVAPEMARMVLPQSMMTSWYWTGNLLAFMHVYNERIDPHAQLEAQVFAKELGEVLKQEFPISFGALRRDA